MNMQEAEWLIGGNQHLLRSRKETEFVRFKEPENNLSQENETKTRRTFCYYQSIGTGDL